MTVESPAYPGVVFSEGRDLPAVRLIIHRAIHSARDYVARSGGLEVVGIIWSDSTVTPLINQAKSATRFAVSEKLFAETIANVDPEEKTMVSLYHSHPGGSFKPSALDSEMIKEQFNRGIRMPWTIIPHDRYVWGLWWYEKWGDGLVVGDFYHTYSKDEFNVTVPYF